MKKSKKITGILSAAIVLLLVACIVFLIVVKAQNKVAFLFGYSLVYVLSDSMEPEFYANSYIIVESVDPQDVEVGDIITFYSSVPEIEGKLNTHKVIAINEERESFETLGTKRGVPDSAPAYADNVVGRYVGRAEILSAFASVFRTKIGLIVTLLLILILCFGLYLPDLIRNVHKAKALKTSDKDEWMARKIQEEVERLQREGLPDQTSNHTEK